MSDRYLVISALGKDRPGIVNTLSKSVLDSGCNVSHSRMAVLGGEFALILLIHGNEEAVAAMQRQLPALEERLQLSLNAKTTAPRHSEQRWLPYRERVVAMDHPGIVHRITEFFSAQKINIEELETATYAAPHTGTPMFSLTMTVAVPAGTAVARLREGFIEFCDGMNLEANHKTTHDKFATRFFPSMRGHTAQRSLDAAVCRATQMLFVLLCLLQHAVFFVRRSVFFVSFFF